MTSATTMLGMLAAGMSGIPMISAFGLLGVLVIFFDFVLVATSFPEDVACVQSAQESRLVFVS